MQKELAMAATKPFWLRNEEGEAVRFFDQVYTLKASGDMTGGSFGLVEVTTPEGSGPPPHVHAREDEAFYVLEGRYEVTVGEEQFEAAEGTFVFAPRNVPHAVESGQAPRLRVPDRMGNVLPRLHPRRRRGSRPSADGGHGKGPGRGVGRAAAPRLRRSLQSAAT
jgi:quercetin dioxygenase-like cupin family protein